jgi:HPt (histidine-containing phosphotransfer) domain-containing protein
MHTVPPKLLGRIVVQPPSELPRMLVCEYLEDCRKDLSRLNAALVAGDYQRAQVFGHQMKATGSPYGFPDLTILGSAIEQAAAHKNAPELDHLLGQLADYVRRVEIAGD